MTKICYDNDLLQEVCDRDRCIIDFDKIDKYNREIKVDFVCNCGIVYSKTFRLLYKIGAFCKICTKNKRREKVKLTCIERYGVEFPSQTEDFKNRVKQTCLDKYGVEYALQSQEVKDKSKQTCLDKYGFENPSQSPDIKNKKTETSLNNYGVEYPMQSQEVRDKNKLTCIEKYGVEYASQSYEVRDKLKTNCLTKELLEKICSRDKCIIIFDKLEKCNRDTEINFICNCGIEYSKTFRQIYDVSGGYCKKCTENRRNDKVKQTSILNYGVEYPMQNAEFSEKQSKNAYKLKEFNFPCGKTIVVQGYEPILLKSLVEEGYIYEDIIVKRTEVPLIWYEKDNKKHRYYCDVYIPKINTIYEVKSTWTYEKDIEDIPLKKQACIDAGYLFELYVYDGKGIRQEI
jgi:hypothetical protein